jgi:hypothetical protein
MNNEKIKNKFPYCEKKSLRLVCKLRLQKQAKILYF